MNTLLNIHFFVDGQSLGQGRIPAIPTDCHQDQQSKGFAFFCHHCGKMWASCPISNEDHKGIWHVIHAICGNHPKATFTIPGSMWKPGYVDLINAFSPEVLKRELFLHMDFIERMDNEHCVY